MTANIWDQVLARIETKVNRHSFYTWFKPTAFVAEWGSGKPVIGFMADIDGLPETSQKPGVAYHDPLIPNGPGHGEGHNAGQAVNVGPYIGMAEEGLGDRDFFGDPVGGEALLLLNQEVRFPVYRWLRGVGLPVPKM